MYSRWANVAVVVLWLMAMGWLAHSKLLPPLLTGEPPNRQTIIEAQRRDPTVAWAMTLNGQKVGWATSSTSWQEDGLTRTESRVQFQNLPLDDLIPGWLRKLMPPIHGPEKFRELEANNATTIDALGRLAEFRSEVRIAPLDDPIRMDGTIEGTHLMVHVTAGEFVYDTEVPIPQKALINDALSPQTQLPGIQLGQTWTVPVYSPLRPPTDPIDLLTATVERTTSFVWCEQPVEAFVVVYRRESGHGLGCEDQIRGKLWVRQDGTVLKQEVRMLGSTMTFERLPGDWVDGPETRVNRNPGRHPRP